MPLIRLPDFIADAIAAIGRRLFGGQEEKGVALGVMGAEPCRPAEAPRTRIWSAASRSVEPGLVHAIRDGFSRITAMPAGHRNESTSGMVLIEPILRALEFENFSREVGNRQGRPEYRIWEQNAAVEIKDFNPAYDQIIAHGGNSRFATIADQVIHYLDEFDLAAVIYTNGRFWWRVERDGEAVGLFALRFNMNTAHNMLIRRDDIRQLGFFVPLFHADAFRPHGNFNLPVHAGQSQAIGNHGNIWLKDISEGYGKALTYSAGG
jgi:hypothetical protein